MEAMKSTGIAEAGTVSGADVKGLPHQILDGIMHFELLSPAKLREAHDYVPQSGDVCLNTYPRCGSNWMHYTVYNIFRKGREIDPSFYRQACPILETVGLDGIRRLPRPGAYKTHLPFTHVQYSTDAKYIFLARNPKDCCVANYNLMQTLTPLQLGDMEFDEYFEYFLSGEVYYNDYFDHLMAWYPYRNHPNVFHTTYERMKENPTAVVIKLAAFLGKEYAQAIEQDSSVLRNILHNTSFVAMKEKFNPIYCFEKPEEISKLYPDDVPEGLSHIKEKLLSGCIVNKKKPTDFFRKGVVGDWKNWFSPEQVKRLDEKFIEKTKGTEFPLWYPVSQDF